MYPVVKKLLLTLCLRTMNSYIFIRIEYYNINIEPQQYSIRKAISQSHQQRQQIPGHWYQDNYPHHQLWTRHKWRIIHLGLSTFPFSMLLNNTLILSTVSAPKDWFLVRYSPYTIWVDPALGWSAGNYETRWNLEISEQPTQCLQIILFVFHRKFLECARVRQSTKRWGIRR